MRQLHLGYPDKWKRVPTGDIMGIMCNANKRIVRSVSSHLWLYIYSCRREATRFYKRQCYATPTDRFFEVHITIFVSHIENGTYTVPVAAITRARRYEMRESKEELTIPFTVSDFYQRITTKDQ